MKYSLLFMLIFFSFGCEEKINDEFILYGNFEQEDIEDNYVYLSKINDDLITFTDLDSVMVSNREFLFKGKAVDDKLEARYIFTDKNREIKLFQPVKMFVPESGKIFMTIDKDGCSTLSGSVNNNKLNGLLESFIEVYKKVNDLNNVTNNNNEKAEGSLLSLEMIGILSKLNSDTYAYLMDIKGSPLFDEVYLRYSVFLGTKQRKKLNEYFGRLYDKIVADSKKRSETGNAKIGEPFLDLNCKDLKNNDIKLSSYINGDKIILLDFWASWCTPCIAEIPQLKEIYAKYKDSGFEIISISIDEDRNEWLKAVTKQDMPWLQLFSKRDKKTAMDIYGFNGIPYTILIDKDGKVIAKNIRGEEIITQIQKTLTNEQK